MSKVDVSEEAVAAHIVPLEMEGYAYERKSALIIRELRKQLTEKEAEAALLKEATSNVTAEFLDMRADINELRSVLKRARDQTVAFALDTLSAEQATEQVAYIDMLLQTQNPSQQR